MSVDAGIDFSDTRISDMARHVPTLYIPTLFFYSVFSHLLFLFGIVDGEVESARLLALLGLTHDQIADIDNITQLADLSRCLGAFEEFLGLLIENVKTVPGALQA